MLVPKVCGRCLDVLHAMSDRTGYLLQVCTILLAGQALVPDAIGDTDTGKLIRYSLLERESDIRLLVYRQGLLSLLGHNHVISSSRMQGSLLYRPNSYSGDFRIDIEVVGLEVDLQQDRQRSGHAFQSEIDASTAEITRQRMLGPQLLFADRYPIISIEGRIQSIEATYYALIDITIKSISKQYRAPLQLHIDDTGLNATGRLTIKQSDFDMKALTMLGGLLAVNDEVNVVFDISGRPATD